MTGMKLRTDTVFVLIIFCFFAISVLTVLMLGGNAYKTVTEFSREGYGERTCLAYLWTKVKNGDEGGNVFIGEFHGLPALCLEEEYDGAVYRTTIYQYGGWVRELFCEAGLSFLPEDGRPVIELDLLSFEQLEDGLIRARAGSAHLLISPRGIMGDNGGAPN